MLYRPVDLQKTSLSSLLLLPLLAALLAGCPATKLAEDAGPLEDALPELGPDLKPSGDEPPSLALGDFLDFAFDEGGKANGSVSVTGSEKFLALLISTDDTARKTHAYSSSESSVQPMRLPEPAPFPGGPLPGHSNFGARMNAILRAAAGKPLLVPKPYLMAGLPPKLGEQRTFKIESGSAHVTITAEVIFVDGVAAYWLDRTSQPLASITDSTLKTLADGFGRTVVPRLRTYFGKESDVDGDGTISVLFSPLVAKAGALAYVSPCDLLDASYCPSGNHMELLYMTPPSSLGGYGASPIALLETAAHELQHAIYFYRKFVAQKNVLSLENPYITEGLSALAQDLSGYQATTNMLTGYALQYVNDISVPDATHGSIHDYLPGDADSYLRGEGYLLLRYLFDRAGGDALDDGTGEPKDMGGITFLRSFIESKPTGLAGLAGASGLSPEDLMVQFWTTLGLSNRGPGGGPINSDPKLNFKPVSTDPVTGRTRGCSLFGTAHGFKLSGPKTQSVVVPDGSLRAGGAEYLAVSAGPGQARLGFTVEAPSEAKARVRLIRIQ